MWRKIEPDERHELTIQGYYRVVAYDFGDGPETVLCLKRWTGSTLRLSA